MRMSDWSSDVCSSDLRMVTVRLVRVRIPRLVPVSDVYLMLRGAGAQAEHLKPLLGSGERLIAGKGLVDRADAPPVHAADSLDVFRDRDHVVGRDRKSTRLNSSH